MSTRKHAFNAEWDQQGVYFYQAYNDDIADWAVNNQRLGGPSFNPHRMTWMKPSFAWMLYRSGYATKPNQQRILKIKLAHLDLAEILVGCSIGHGGGGTNGRIQWDPARCLMTSENGEPKKSSSSDERAIQIGIKGPLSRTFVDGALQITDVTALAKLLGTAHGADDVPSAMQALESQLPNERPYIPLCDVATSERLRISTSELVCSITEEE